jgi:hypothetical protein
MLLVVTNLDHIAFFGGVLNLLLMHMQYFGLCLVLLYTVVALHAASEETITGTARDEKSVDWYTSWILCRPVTAR